MIRTAYLALSGLIYIFFLLTFVALIGFVSGHDISPVSIDRGPVGAPMATVLWDTALLTLFGLQHSWMARPAFKARWTRIVPIALERSVFVACASAILWVVFLLWRPIPSIIWDATNTLVIGALWATFALGWIIVLASTFLINHFELFGLQQALTFARSRPPGHPVFVTPFLYRFVRHPLYAGFLLAFWSVPLMTLGHLLFALVMTAYVLIAIVFEERDLVVTFGEPYRRYQATVGKLLPRFRS